MTTLYRPPVGVGACCDKCAQTGGSCGCPSVEEKFCGNCGGPCGGSFCGTCGGACPCSALELQGCQGIPIPGWSSFPVGFGQNGSSTTQVATDAVTAWAVPLTIGLVSVAAGFGLAYALSKR